MHHIFIKIIFLHFVIGDNCQYWMDIENQKLSSPYYPQLSFAHADCEWLIIASEGNIITLEFDHFDVSKI